MSSTTINVADSTRTVTKSQKTRRKAPWSLDYFVDMQCCFSNMQLIRWRSGKERDSQVSTSWWWEFDSFCRHNI